MSVLTIRYTNGAGDQFISAITIHHNSVAATIAEFEVMKRDSAARVTHYLNVDKIYGFGNKDSDWIKVPYYLT